MWKNRDSKIVNIFFACNPRICTGKIDARSFISGQPPVPCRYHLLPNCQLPRKVVAVTIRVRVRETAATATLTTHNTTGQQLKCDEIRMSVTGDHVEMTDMEKPQASPQGRGKPAKKKASFILCNLVICN